jgi:hypothetical protein
MAIWIFWCAFIASSIACRTLLVDVLVASPLQVLGLLSVRTIIYVGLTLQMLRGAGWARMLFAILFLADVLDTFLSVTIILEVTQKAEHPRDRGRLRCDLWLGGISPLLRLRDVMV